MVGHRAITADGWKAVTRHQAGTPFDDDVWELYHLDQDFSEVHDLAADQPERLRQLEARWWELAERYGVLPIDDRLIERLVLPGPPGNPRRLTELTFHPGATRVPGITVPNTPNRSFAIEIDLAWRLPSDAGVLVRHGTVSGGYVIHVVDGRVRFEHNRFGTRTRLAPEVDLPPGATTIGLRFDKTETLTGTFALSIDGTEVGRTAPVATLAIAFGAWFEIGADSGSPVSWDYEPPAPFTGEIAAVRVHLADDDEVIGILDLID
jgi:arylsulfatase